MIPSIDNQHYPVFVPDQVLTSQNLNDLFNYQDEQGRMTRANLIGIGIVCGLEIKTGVDANGPYIIITKGTGVTSEGYLVTVDETKYHKFSKFDPVQCRYYDPFVNVAQKKERFPIWEMKQFAEPTASQPLSSIPGGLADKVVLLFVELLETNNKNCDPNSCDDKGITINVNIKPLLVKKVDAVSLISNDEAGVPAITFNDLTPLRMPRWDVPNTTPVSSSDILNAYRKVLTETFIQSVETALTEAYKEFKPVIVHEYPTDPFLNLSDKFAFLKAALLTTGQVLHIQYYYDFFSDLLQAYDEFCKTGKTILSTCCPYAALFPRHLLLGEAVPLADDAPSEFRHYFIYSPLFECKHLLFNLRTLFERMDMMIKTIDTLPPVVTAGGNANNDANIRVTPSLLGNDPLSDKAIPYYYKINKSTFALYKWWSPEKKLRNHTDQVLSYHAGVYSTVPHVINPLRYDLEPYNFLRIEGIVGKPVTAVLRNVQRHIKDNRLPIQVVALKTGDVDTSGVTPQQMDCNTKDLEINYDVVRREWEAIIGKTIEYIDDVVERVKSLLGNDKAKWLNDFKVDLHLAKTFMVDDLPVFSTRYEEFMVVFERIEATAENLRKQFMALLEIQTAPTSASKLIEDIIDHLDEVILSCRKGAFRAVYQEYQRRIVDIFGKQFFGYYAEHNPGIQHKAGVPVGGTFLLVYHAKPVLKGLELPKGTKFTTGRFSVRGKISDITNVAILGAQVSEVVSAAKSVTGANGNYSLLLFRLPAVITIKAPGYQTEQIIISAAGSNYNINLTPIAVSEKGYDNISDGTVIADFYLPYTCCSDCAPVQFVVQDPPPNKPPVAMAGEDITIRLPINEVELNGINSKDPEGRMKSYHWVQKSGPDTALMENADAPITKVSELKIGVYIFELSVADDQGESSKDEVKITVLEAINIPPVANAGADATITLPNTLTLTGTASDTDGTIASTLWTVKAGSPTGSSFTAANNLVTRVNGLVAGTYTFILTATDNRGGVASDEVVITVNRLPVVTVTANPTTVVLPIQMIGCGAFSTELTSTIVDDTGDTHTYNWTRLSGPTSGFGIQTPTVKDTRVNFTEVGTYVFRLTANDGKGGIGVGDVTVTVVRANQPPILAPTATLNSLILPQTGGTVTSLLRANVSDPDVGDAPTVAWALFSGTTGGATMPANTTTPNITVSFSQPGTYVFQVTANDGKPGGTATAQTTVTVTRQVNQPPTAAAKANPNPAALDDNYMVEIELDGSSSNDTGGAIASYAWAQTSGDAQHVVIVEPNKPVTKARVIWIGSFDFRLTVTDAAGLPDTDTVKVTVNLPPGHSLAQKSCGKLTDTMQLADSVINNPATSGYDLLPTATQDRIKRFYGLMANQNVAAMPLSGQLGFLREQGIDSLLKIWIDEITSILSNKPEILFTLPEVINLHANLAYYIACVQPGDINNPNTFLRMNDAVVALQTASAKLGSLTKDLAENDRKKASGKFSNTTKGARAQVIIGNEQTAKSNYLQRLVNIIFALNV